MAIYMVSYDLHKKGEFDYENLIDAIKAYGTWCHMLESDWAIVTSQTAVEVRTALLPHIHRDDHLFVARLQGEAAWYGLSDEKANWLKRNLEQNARA